VVQQEVARRGEFRLEAPFQPTGDQPQAIEKLVESLERGNKFQTLLGVTGSGKSYTIANVIAKHQRPTLVLCHNKTLAAQLYSEFREFFPDNAVEYFVSYFDYYQPEAYLPRSDTYIEKDSSRNDEIDKLRHAATRALVCFGSWSTCSTSATTLRCRGRASGCAVTHWSSSRHTTTSWCGSSSSATRSSGSPK